MRMLGTIRRSANLAAHDRSILRPEERESGWLAASDGNYLQELYDWMNQD